MGGDMAQCISRIIKSEFKNSVIFGIDISKRNAAKMFCDHFEIAPRANSEKFLDYITSLLEKNNIDYFIPCTEHELRVIAHLPESHPLWKKTITCSKSILEICLDKNETFKFLKKNNIPVPWFTEDIDTIEKFPCIYKKKSSSGSRDIFQVSDKKEAAFLKNFSKDGLFQEYLSSDDSEYTCSIFQWNDGTFQVIQLLRTLTGGSTSWARVENVEVINELCKKIAQAFNLNGSLNIQLRMTPEGPMIFEINPRFSSTVYMRHLLGFKDVTWSIKKFQNEDLGTIPVMPFGKEMAKISEIATL